MRNSLLVEWSRTENITGLKPDTEATGLRVSGGGRGAFCRRRSRTVRSGGACRSENAGMSNVKHVRTVFAVSLRFPTEGQSASG